MDNQELDDFRIKLKMMMITNNKLGIRSIKYKRHSNALAASKLSHKFLNFKTNLTYILFEL